MRKTAYGCCLAFLRTDPNHLHLVRVWFFLNSLHPKKGKRRRTHAPSPVSCLLCTQQQLHVNAWGTRRLLLPEPQSCLHVGSLGGESIDPGVEEEYQKFTCTHGSSLPCWRVRLCASPLSPPPLSLCLRLDCKRLKTNWAPCSAARPPHTLPTHSTPWMYGFTRPPVETLSPEIHLTWILRTVWVTTTSTRWAGDRCGSAVA